tara:strand:- start:473 stop:1408 length:936 start_codon:yes stop_codon:yes gene_type:complete
MDILNIPLPTKLNEIDFHSNLKNKFNNLLNKPLFSFGLYGPSSNGKKTFIKCFLNTYFNKNIITKLSSFKLSNNYYIYYKECSIYFELLPSDYIQNNNIILTEFLNHIKFSTINIIIIYNINLFINTTNLLILKKFISDNPYKIILFTSNKPINLFFNIRVPALSYHELLKLSLYLNNHFNFKFSIKKLNTIVNSSDYNLSNLYYIFNQQLLNINYDPILDIFNLIKLNNINDLSTIKKIIKHIYITNNLSLSVIFSKLIKLILQNSDIKINMYILSNIASELQYKSLNNNNKDFIFLEIFIVNIYNLLND